MKIKACPFCGCRDRRVGIRRMGGKGYRVVCGACGASGPYVAIKACRDDKMIAQEAARQGWNNRREEQHGHFNHNRIPSPVLYPGA